MTASWILIAAGKSLFAEFDRIAPNRGHASDGSIGDAAHQRETSDHNPDETGAVPIHDADKTNEVHAIDVDVALNESDLTMERVVQFILGRVRSGAEKRLRYIIYNRRIWEADNSWKQRSYTGASAHTEHAHFSFSYTTSLEASIVSWHLEDIPVAMTAADKTFVTNTIKAEVVKIADMLNLGKPQDDGTPQSIVGNHILVHGVPNGLKPADAKGNHPRSMYYEVVEDLGAAAGRIEAKLDAILPPAGK
jgi:hypothetical protein